MGMYYRPLKLDWRLEISPFFIKAKDRNVPRINVGVLVREAILVLILIPMGIAILMNATIS